MQAVQTHTPVAALGTDARATFIWRVYGHVALAILGFAAIESYLFGNGIAQELALRMLGMNWLLILGAFMVVGEASDGAEALALARVLEPQVVIMDVNMPNMNGIEATEKIIHDRPLTIVIGISFGTEDYVVRAMQASGAVTCLPKERAVEDVCQVIMDAVAARRQTQHG